jgi:hypothetical protein
LSGLIFCDQQDASRPGLPVFDVHRHRELTAAESRKPVIPCESYALLGVEPLQFLRVDGIRTGKCLYFPMVTIRMHLAVTRNGC